MKTLLLTVVFSLIKRMLEDEEELLNILRVLFLTSCLVFSGSCLKEMVF